MAFSAGQILSLPELANQLGLKADLFRIERILNGGMGECLRIVQNEQWFALKVIRKNIIEIGDAWDRYRRELRLWTTLSACDGVVEAFCIIRINELPVVCSRWMDGGSLHRHLENRSPEFFYSVMARIVGTLAWVYEQHKIIHRDLKPENILLDEEGRAFVSDWGLARPLANGASAAGEPRSSNDRGPVNLNLTDAGKFLGTVYYASPEQLLGQEDIDHRADIYSLGCLMYQWEAGTCPFTGATAEEIALKHLFEAPPPLALFPRKTTFGSEAVIRSCLEKDPNHRFPDYLSLDLALEQAARRRGVEYQRFSPKLRYLMPMVGGGEFLDHTQARGLWNKTRTHCVLEYSEIEPYIQEAQALSAIGDYTKAAQIYGSLFVPGIAAALPDHQWIQAVAIAYAHCLTSLDRHREAIETLDFFKAVKEKPAEYFVNRSFASIRLGDFSSAAATAGSGLKLSWRRRSYWQSSCGADRTGSVRGGFGNGKSEAVA